MPAYFRRDDNVQNGLGYAIPNCAVTYYTQPSLALATVYNDGNGDEEISNPQFTDGLGHTAAYMAAGLYTIVYSGMQIQTLTFPDQDVGGAGSGSSITLFAGIPQGTIDGTNRVFTLTNAGVPLTSVPSQVEVWKNFSLIPNDPAGYTITGISIVYAVAPQPPAGGGTGDSIWAQGVILS